MLPSIGMVKSRNCTEAKECFFVFLETKAVWYIILSLHNCMCSRQIATFGKIIWPSSLSSCRTVSLPPSWTEGIIPLAMVRPHTAQPQEAPLYLPQPERDMQRMIKNAQSLCPKLWKPHSLIISLLVLKQMPLWSMGFTPKQISIGLQFQNLKALPS